MGRPTALLLDEPPMNASRLLLGFFLLLAPTAILAQERPNIVLIFADDLGVHDLHCYGRDDHATPNLDRLASSGSRFTSAYCASPICSASRAGLMTGKHPARLHLTTYLPGRPDAASQKLLNPRIETSLIPGEPTLAELLKRAGYATGLFGKWHLGGGAASPKNRGFDVVFEPAGNGDPAATGGKNEFLITDKAIEFIQTPREQPFFCYVPHHSPHIQLKETPEKVAANAGAWNPLYAATIASLDESVGRLLAAIEASPAADNTIVIFTSDNGGLHVPEVHTEPVTHNGPYRAGKGYVYEGGLRIPLIIRWPKSWASGRQVDAPVSLLDLLPTLLEAANVDAGRAVGPLDGQSIAGLLSPDEAAFRAAEQAAQKRTFYWHLPHYTNQGSRPAGALRRGDLKLVEHFENDAVELYDLAADLGEKKNLAEQRSAEASQLHSALAAWRKQIAAQLPEPNPDWNEALHRRIYIEQDSTLLAGAQSTAAQIAAEWKAWRAAMNQAVAGKKTLLKQPPLVTLLPQDAKLHGARLRYEPEPNKNVLGYWTEVDDWAEWTFESAHEGPVEIVLHCGCQGGGSEVDVILACEGREPQTIPWRVRDTGHFQKIVIESLGVAQLAKGKATLQIRPKKKAGVAIGDIRLVRLLPAAAP